MNEMHDLNNLFAWSLQTGILVAIAGMAVTAFRLSAPNAKLLYWQLTLAACLLLPFIRAWKQETIVLTNTLAAPVSVAASALVPPARSIPFETVVMYLLGLISIARLGWLAAGLVRMSGYRRRSRPIPRQPQWGVEAELRVSKDITSPVTFGFVNPIILLPPDFMRTDESHREAILCHEFLHVRRRDWLFTVGEELIRTAFWFHPAIWWVLGEIQLAREQVVDQEAIGITQSRDKYVDALLAIAGAIPQRDLATASPFLRRRHLRQRVVSILKEVRMSRTRAVSSLAAGLLLLAASCWLVTGAIALYGAPQVVSDAPGVSVDINGASLLHRSPVVYPSAAVAKRIEGTVTVLVKLDDRANVIDASVVSGPDELRKVVLQSVLNWHFTKDAANSTRQIAIQFRVPADSATPTAPAPRQPFALEGGRSGRIVPQALIGQPVTGQQTGTLKTINIGGLSDQQEAELLALLPVHVGDAYTPDVLDKVIAAVHAYDEHLRVAIGSLSPTEFALQISTPDTPPPPFFVPPPPPPPQPSVPGAIGVARIGSAVMQSKIVSQAAPVYPPLARAARVQGTIVFDATIGVDGRVMNLRLISGPPLLVQAAMTVVQQWVYQPTLLNGKPVEVNTSIEVNFTLQDQ
jgi:TonB family protein